MYEIRVEHTFSAAHALTIGSAVEPLHGHDWRVRVTLAGSQLDADALLCDFHTVENALRDVCKPYHNRTLNDAPPFSEGVNPSAERVAKAIADELQTRIGDALAPHARIVSVSVTEAPGCEATYRPEHARASEGGA